MRRCVILIIAAVIIISVSGCRKDDDAVSQAKIDLNRAANHYGTNFCMTDDMIYYISPGRTEYPNLLVYYDRKSGSGGPLCGKPECLHDGPDCNAYMGYSNAYGLSSYNNRLYYIYDEFDDAGGYSGSCIRSMNYDGTGLKNVGQYAENGAAWFNGTNGQYLFSDGYLFSCCSYQTIENGESVSKQYVAAYSLAEGSVRILYEKETKEQIVTEFLQAYDGTLYFMTAAADADSTENENDVTIFEWEMGSDECRASVSFSINEPVFEFVRKGEEFLVSTRESHVFAVNEQGVHKFLDLTEDGVYGSSVVTADRYLISYSYPDMPDYSKYRLIIYDTDGKRLLDQTEKEVYRDDMTYYGRWPLGADADNVYFAFWNISDPDNNDDFLSAYSVLTGDRKELWNSRRKGEG